MCCRLTVKPLDIDLAKGVLAIGMFEPVDSVLVNWKRLAEDGTVVRAIIAAQEDALRLELNPSISTYAQHADKRIAGGIYFEIAAKYAEKVNGAIMQLSNVAGCGSDGLSQRVLAVYPDQPLLWERVCPGFREVILGAGNENCQ